MSIFQFQNLRLEPSLEDIIEFVKDFSGSDDVHANSDLTVDVDIYGDDWDDLFESFAKKYQVDMTGYLWYFHTSEEGYGFNPFIKPPNRQVDRIPLTPNDLLRFARKKRWSIHYPEHKIITKRWDVAIVAIILFIVSLWFMWFKL